jgi:hypothetical protein
VQPFFPWAQYGAFLKWGLPCRNRYFQSNKQSVRTGLTVEFSGLYFPDPIEEVSPYLIEN